MELFILISKLACLLVFGLVHIKCFFTHLQISWHVAALNTSKTWCRPPPPVFTIWACQYSKWRPLLSPGQLIWVPLSLPTLHLHNLWHLERHVLTTAMITCALIMESVFIKNHGKDRKDYSISNVFPNLYFVNLAHTIYFIRTPVYLLIYTLIQSANRWIMYHHNAIM